MTLKITAINAKNSIPDHYNTDTLLFYLNIIRRCLGVQSCMTMLRTRAHRPKGSGVFKVSFPGNVTGPKTNERIFSILEHSRHPL